MRKTLQKQEGLRKKFQAVFIKRGKKLNYHGYSEETILLKNIMDVESQTVITDHVWFAFTKGFQRIGLMEGDQIVFEARIKKYVKGYVNSRYQFGQKRTDYRLSHPTKIRLVKL